MAHPSDKHVKLFRRVAAQRMEDAEWLLEANPPRSNASVYLAGYVVECCLKALLLNAVPGPRRETVVRSFRGVWAHDYDELRRKYGEEGGARFPLLVLQAFNVVGKWTTTMRYSPKSITLSDAREFLRAAAVVFEWTMGRL
jgi:HEPN domain-containing protein